MRIGTRLATVTPAGRLLPAVLALLALSIPVPKANAESDGLEFFEKRIRPVLVQHCYECHSAEADELSAELAVDTREGLRRGGANGPAVVPGDPESSFLLRVLRYEEDDYQMPPNGKLPDDVIADFEHWIEDGAADPREGSSPSRADAGVDLEAGRQFWSFQPPRQGTLPEVRRRDWPRTSIDHFLLARMEAAGLAPAAPAPRHALLRRLYFDLIGLPPTAEQLRAFLTDDSPLAWPRAVDRLLNSPRFGERWGRHWLDVARYADSNGLDQNLTHYQAWRYRDYVIRAFNEDRSFDRFVVEQLAGDLLPSKSDQQRAEQLVATGFLMMGPKQLSERDKEKLRMDVVDEQIDTVGKAFLGLTLGCARCHDHKFDPVPQTDYYGLAGIFRNTITVDGIKLNNVFVSGWKLRPLPIATDHAAALAEYNEAMERVTEQLNAARARLKTLDSAAPAPQQWLGVVVDDTQATRVGLWKESTYTPRFIGEGYVHDDREQKGMKSITFSAELPEEGEYEVRIAYTPGSGRSPHVPVTVRHATGEQTLLFDQRSAPTIAGLFKPLGRFHFTAGPGSSVTLSNTGTAGSHVVADAVQFLPVRLLQEQTSLIDDPPAGASGEREQLQQAVQELEQRKKQLDAAAPPPAPMAMAPGEVEQPEDYFLLIRGNHQRPGERVPRGVLQVATHHAPQFDQQQSGRRQLAEWIASPHNPLTARVLVNRLWMHLFGEGLVRSVDNFGLQGQPPTHPELLDHLAVEFVRHDWSIKQMVRELVLSAAYQTQVSHPEAETLDPENHLWSHALRRRLDAEAMRDATLTLSGQLDLMMGGSFVADLGEQAINNESKSPIDIEAIARRSVYLPILRSDLPPVLAAFDFADPEMVVGRRETTTVATQALYLMNSPFVARQAEYLARRAKAAGSTDGERTNWLYQSLFARLPSPQEQAYISRFLTATSSGAEHDQAEQDGWSALCHMLLASTEFRFLE